MTDLDPLTGTIAARLRTIPEVAQLFTARSSRPRGPLGTAAEVLTALSDDRGVDVDVDVEDGVTRITVSLAATSAAPAPATARAAADAIAVLLDASGVQARHITVRVASITR